MKKKVVSIIMAGALAVSALGLGGCKKEGSESGDAWQMSYWIPKAEDAKFYDEYEENPVLQYIEANYEFNGKKIDIDFFTAPPGSEQDDFNTLLGTEEYCDIMDLSMSTTTAAELYQRGVLQDLTDLYKEHMPNYTAFLEANPDVAEDIYSIVDGEKKVLTLHGIAKEQDDPFEGYVYRRDWVAKYGKNPQTGKAFTYGFADESDPQSWEDDVVFPSGGDEPIYISDWEWMFDIFAKAMDDLGITDGYCYAPYYLGYLETGDLSSGFGGGGGMGIHIDGDKVVDGYTSDTARAYLQCMSNWYQKGWLDKNFSEHTSDMFFAIDTEKVYQGKVGLWQGRPSAVGNQLDAGDEYTKGIMVYGAKLPINDVYGGEAQKNKEPDAYMRTTKLGGGIGLTNKLEDDEVIAFMEFVDFLFSEEGSMLKNYGLNKEQYEEFGSELYDELGITEGNYTVDEEGTVHMVFSSDKPESIAVTLGRCIGLTDNVNLDKGYDRFVGQATSAWKYYENSAALRDSVKRAVTTENQKEIDKLKANLDQYLARTIPTIIMGTGSYDVNKDADWERFVKDTKKYGSGKMAEYYQEALELLYGASDKSAVNKNQ